MQRKLGILAALLLLCGLVLGVRGAAAQGLGGVNGIVTDMQGKPMPDMVVTLKNVDTGAAYTVKTDKNGHYSQVGLRPGIYELTLKPKDKDQVIATLKFQMGTESDNRLDIDLRKLTLNPEQEAARAKQEEEQKKFQNMKEAYAAGQAKLAEADTARTAMSKSPADQRAAQQPKVSGLYQEALQNFQQAQQTAPEKDPNLHLIYHQLGYAYEMIGNHEAAIAAYQKAIELKPAAAEYYINLSVALAKAGKVSEASQACEKAASLDPSKGATAWLNLGVVLYNANRLNEAVEPLKKATALSPNNAQAWYLLGASLVASMDVKQEGDKVIPVLKPGTIEAYQKCIELDPNGPWGAQAKQGLEQLQALGAGVETKVKVKKTKP